MAKKKKKPASQKQKQATKKSPLKAILIISVAALLIAAVVAVIVVQSNIDNEKHALRNTYWVSRSAKNASGDEVDVREVYNVKYSQYQGRLSFDDKDRFELWLQPGDAADGTHSGTYETQGDKVDVVFDEGTETQFLLTHSGSDITAIELNYGDYTVRFVKSEPF